MDYSKKLLIAIIIIVLTVVLWRLIKRRNEIKSSIENFDISSYIPNITSPPTKDAELLALKDDVNSVKIVKINSNHTHLPLKEYCIKGAYNAAYTGGYINQQMVTYVLSRGCRYLDFEVFYINNDKLTTPQVSVSIDPAFNKMSTTNNDSVLLDTILSTAISGAFSDTSPNRSDPLFINLRIKSNNNEVYHAVAKSIHNTLGDHLYTGKIMPNTKLSDLMGKVVLFIDTTINKNYLNSSKCADPHDDTCYDLSNYVNLESGGPSINILHYSDMQNLLANTINLNKDTSKTDVKRISLLNPDMISNQKKNINFNPMVYKYACQIVPNLYYLQPAGKDDELLNYEKFFNDNSAAIVPFSIALPYFNKLSQSQMQNVKL
jgi:hypothetical protein